MKSWAGVGSGGATPGCLKEDHACVRKCSGSFFSSQLTRRLQCLDFRRRMVYQSDSEQLFKHTHSVSRHRLQKNKSFGLFLHWLPFEVHAVYTYDSLYKHICHFCVTSTVCVYDRVIGHCYWIVNGLHLEIACPCPCPVQS